MSARLAFRCHKIHSLFNAWEALAAAKSVVVSRCCIYESIGRITIPAHCRQGLQPDGKFIL
jgi:hypothetical protein